jgi:hypothetical protein
MKAIKLFTTIVSCILGVLAAVGQDLSENEIDAGTLVLTNKLDLTNMSSLGQPAGQFVTSDGAGGVQYSSFVASNAGPWQFVPTTDGSLSITNPESSAHFDLISDGSFGIEYPALNGSGSTIAQNNSFAFSAIATNNGVGFFGNAYGNLATTFYGESEGAKSTTFWGTATTNAPFGFAFGFKAVADAPGAVILNDSLIRATNLTPQSLMLSFLGGVRILGGSLTIPTNNIPSPISGGGTFAVSNYDLYWVTPTKTNLIVLGH